MQNLANLYRRYKPNWLPLFGSLMLAWLIMAPLLRRGFVFALDMVPTPVWRLPAGVTNSFVFYAVLHALNFVIPGDVLQKLLLSTIFVLMSLGAYRLAAYIEQGSHAKPQNLGAYLAGVLYVLNPFVYSRFMAGQYAVLLGYALLPWFVRAWLALLQKPGWQQSVRVGVWLAVIGIVSIHTLGLCAIVLLVGLIARSWQLHHAGKGVATVVKASSLAAAVFVAASSYWIVPLVAGRGSTAQAISGFGLGDQEAFATLGGNVLGRTVHVLGLQGFWVERWGFYRSPSSLGLLWWLAMVMVLGLIFVGARRYWRQRKRVVAGLLGASLAIAVVLAAGVGNGWLSSHVPFFAGYREPHKFAGLVALAYAIFAGSGAAATWHWAERHADWLKILLAGMLVATPFLWAPSMLFGGGHQLHVSQYPAGWYRVNERLNRDRGDYQVLFLPWHLYMHFGFSGTIMANPAAKFFDKTVLVNNSPELGNAAPSTPNAEENRLGKILVSAPQRQDMGTILAPYAIKYVIVANEADIKNYAYISRQHDLQLVYHGPTIALYRNNAWGSR